MERKLIHRMQELPHAAVKFQTNEFMSLVRMHPVVRDTPAPEKKVAELHDSQTSSVWNNLAEGGGGVDIYEEDDGADDEVSDED